VGFISAAGKFKESFGVRAHLRRSSIPAIWLNNFFDHLRNTILSSDAFDTVIGILFAIIAFHMEGKLGQFMCVFRNGLNDFRNIVLVILDDSI